MPVGGLFSLHARGFQEFRFRVLIFAVRNTLPTIVITLLLAFVPFAVSAAAEPAKAGLSSDTTIIVDVRLNGQAFGEVEVVRSEDGDFWLRSADLATFKVSPGKDAGERSINGQAHIAMRSLGAQLVTFDERTLSLTINLPAELFPLETSVQYKQTFAVRAEESPFSSFFNYRAAASRGETSDTKQFSLAAELGARVSSVLFRHEASWTVANNLREVRRIATQAIYDDTERLNRWTFGDSSATSGALGSNFSLIGVNFARLYAINPAFVRQPLATFSGSALLPSQIEVMASGVPIFRGDIKPGSFALRDLYYAGGARMIDVRIRDAAGRVETITFPFYFAEGLLAKGLSEYSFSFGRRRDTSNLIETGKDKTVALGFYRVGVTDFITLGLRGEASRELSNAGPTLAAKSDVFGIVEFAYSASRRDANATRGNAASVAYTYASPLLTARYGNVRYSESYANLVSIVADARPLRSQRLDLTTGNRALGTFSLGVGTTTFADGNSERATMLGWNRTLFARAQIFASITDIRGDRQERRGFIGLNYNFNADENALALVQKTPAGNTQSLQFSRNVPQGEGLGYRIEVEREARADARQIRVSPFLQYNFSGASVSLNASDQISAGGEHNRRAEVSLFGGLGCVQTACLPSRIVGDSFAIVDLGVPIAGVRITRSNQVVGKTNAAGRLMVSDMGSYYATEIGLNDQDLPIEYGFNVASRRISPAYRSGSRIDFGVKRIFSVFGKLIVNVGKRQYPLSNYLVALTQNGRRKIISTEDDGAFYAEDMEPGTYTGIAVVGGTVCQFELAVPKIEGITYDAKNIAICR